MNQPAPIRFLLACFLLAACMIPVVSAFTVTSVTMTPPGYQPAGTPVTVAVAINFPAAGPTTFLNSSDLLISTELVDPDWASVVVVDGKETALPLTSGAEITVPGTLLSFRPSQSVELNVTLSGKIPSDRHPGENMMKIQERDAAKKIVAGENIAMPEITLVPTSAPPVTANVTTTRTRFGTTPALPPAATTPASPSWAGAAVIALAGAALLATMRK